MRDLLTRDQFQGLFQVPLAELLTTLRPPSDVEQLHLDGLILVETGLEADNRYHFMLRQTGPGRIRFRGSVPEKLSRSVPGVGTVPDALPAAHRELGCEGEPLQLSIRDFGHLAAWTIPGTKQGSHRLILLSEITRLLRHTGQLRDGASGLTQSID